MTALTTLRIENTPGVDVESIVNDAISLNRVRLINVEWTSDSSSDLEATITKLKSCIGMDAAGNNTPKAVVSGRVEVSEITEEQLLDINEAFPELEVVSDGVPIHVVTFYNDGTVYATQVVQHGGNATNPGTPTKAPTAQYTYTFTGWNGSLTNVTENLRLYAQYSQTVRTYTVRFYNGSTLLQTVNNVQEKRQQMKIMVLLLALFRPVQTLQEKQTAGRHLKDPMSTPKSQILGQKSLPALTTVLMLLNIQSVITNRLTSAQRVF